MLRRIGRRVFLFFCCLSRELSFVCFEHIFVNEDSTVRVRSLGHSQMLMSRRGKNSFRIC